MLDGMRKSSLGLLSIIANIIHSMMERLAAPLRHPDGARAERAKKRGKRYVIFEILSAERFSREEVAQATIAAMLKLYGEVGLAMSGLKLIDYDEVRRRGIVRVRREEKGRVLAALNYVREIGGKRARIMPIATSGTLRRAREIMTS